MKPLHVSTLMLLGATMGCTAGLSTGTAANVDTRGRFGMEERIDATSAVGDPGFRLYASLAAGAGYLDARGSGYALVSPEVGVEGGRAVRWSAGALYTPRIFFRGPIRGAHGPGLAGQVLFRVARAGGVHSSVVLGPRVSTEAAFGLGEPDTSGSRPAVVLFQLGVVLRWVVFDTTGNKLAF